MTNVARAQPASARDNELPVRTFAVVIGTQDYPATSQLEEIKGARAAATHIYKALLARGLLPQDTTLLCFRCTPSAPETADDAKVIVDTIKGVLDQIEAEQKAAAFVARLLLYFVGHGGLTSCGGAKLLSYYTRNHTKLDETGCGMRNDVTLTELSDAIDQHRSVRDGRLDSVAIIMDTCQVDPAKRGEFAYAPGGVKATYPTGTRSGVFLAAQLTKKTIFESTEGEYACDTSAWPVHGPIFSAFAYCLLEQVHTDITGNSFFETMTKEITQYGTFRRFQYTPAPDYLGSTDRSYFGVLIPARDQVTPELEHLIAKIEEMQLNGKILGALERAKVVRAALRNQLAVSASCVREIVNLRTLRVSWQQQGVAVVDARDMNGAAVSDCIKGAGQSLAATVAKPDQGGMLEVYLSSSDVGP